MSYLMVSMGGAIGALLRFVVGQQVTFPYGTLTVNIIVIFNGIGLCLSGVAVRLPFDLIAHDWCAWWFHDLLRIFA